MDGFLKVPVSSLGDGSSLNLEPYRNTYSPYSLVYTATATPPESDVLVDSYYGLCYDRWITTGGAAYGLTEALPPGPLDSRAVGFLRVPFGRIPLLSAASAADVADVVKEVKAAYPDLTLLFRGQERGYLLNRNADTLVTLYGAQVDEPSFLPSAERRNVNIDAVGAVWCGTLRYALDVWATARKDGSQFRLIHEVGQHYLFHRFALAMAQHYGLPSSGLDVTDDIQVALYFALHQFSPSSRDSSTLTSSKVEKNAVPILYVFGVELESQYVRFSNELLGTLPASRPARQSAYFLHRNWGFARNRAARDLLVAICLQPDGDYRPLPTTTGLFPPASEDYFGRVIESTRLHLGQSLPDLAQFLEHFHWVQPSE